MNFEMITQFSKIKYGEKRMKYDWDKIINSKITVKYDNEIYDLIILKKEGRNIFVSIYDNETNLTKIDIDNFLKGHIGKIIGKTDFKYKIGDIVKTKFGKIEILEKIKINNKKRKEYKYKCLKCGNIDIIDEYCLYNEHEGCNACCVPSRKVIKGYNDIATTHPHLVKYFKNIEDTYNYSSGSGNKVWFKCPDCGFEKEMKIDNFLKYNFSCLKCGDKIPMPQKIMFNVLEQLGVDFETEKIFDWCIYKLNDEVKQGRYDFYFELKNKKYIIETDGGQHKKQHKNSKFLSFEIQKFIDDEKDKLAKEHNIEVIRIDCSQSELEFIKQNILNDKSINDLFDLTKINWIIVLQFVMSSRVIEACNLYNNNLSYNEIMKIMRISNPTLIKYLKTGRKLNKCNYKTQYELGEEHFVQAINLWNDGIKSTIEIGKKLNMNCTSIIKILKKGKEQGLCDYIPIIGGRTKNK